MRDEMKFVETLIFFQIFIIKWCVEFSLIFFGPAE